MMRRLAPVLLVLAVAACGGEKSTPQAGTRGDTSSTYTQVPDLVDGGYVSSYAEAGFHVYWPDGCKGIREEVNEGPTRFAAKEWIYTCRPGGGGEVAYSVRVMREAREKDGSAPTPRFVVTQIEAMLQHLDVRAQRQRPLEAGAIQGVEVQAVATDGSREVWMRGLLVGHDVYTLLALKDEGGLFEDGEARDFFASFRLDGE